MSNAKERVTQTLQSYRALVAQLVATVRARGMVNSVLWWKNLHSLVSIKIVEYGTR